MRLLHVGLACRYEADSDRFYRDLLGLSKQEPKTLPRSLANAIFAVDRELTMINYVSDDVRFEIFITDTAGNTPAPITHTCLTVDDLDGFLARCRAQNVAVAQIPRGNYTVNFIKDYAGNLFEVK